MVSTLYSGLFSPSVTGSFLLSRGSKAYPRPRSHMDAHLIGIDLAQLLLKQNANAERQRLVKAAERTAESAAAGKDTRAEAH